MLDQSQNEYLIQDLAKKTRIKERTIRYYQEEGLLPEPDRSKPAKYTDEHLVRLELILELKKSYLPLREIKEKLIALDYAQAKDLLEKLRANKTENGPLSQTPGKRAIKPDAGSAQEYISLVLNKQAAISEDFSKALSTQHQAGSSRNIAGTPAESWQHILITPGIEILVREPLSSWDRKRLEELIGLAKSIFA